MLGINDVTMRQRSRFSKTLHCLLLRVTPDDCSIPGAYAGAAVAGPSVEEGSEPPPPSLRTLQSADDKSPTYIQKKNLTVN